MEPLQATVILSQGNILPFRVEKTSVHISSTNQTL